MSQSATPATRNAATQRWKPPRVTPFADLTIGPAIWPSRERLRTVANGCGWLRTVAGGCEWLRTVANGCGRLRTVAQRLANTAQPPHSQSETGTIAMHLGKMH